MNHRLAWLVPLLLVACESPQTGPPIAQGAKPAERPPPAAPSHWQCDGLLLSTTLDSRSQQLRLDFSGRSLSLPLASVGAGTRHADRAGNAFVTARGKATLSLAGEPPLPCTRTSTVSPWNEAATRGIVFRAAGNEPGWFVEVGQGDTPALAATLDYGERRIAIARMQGFSGRLGWRGRTAQAVEVELIGEFKPCRDDMSGERFEATVQLTVGDRQYRGCGAFLDE